MLLREQQPGRLEGKKYYRCEIEVLADWGCREKNRLGQKRGFSAQRLSETTASRSEQQRNLSTQVEAGEGAFRVLFERNG